MLFGGMAEKKNGHVGTTDDLFFMKLSSTEVTWSREQINGNQKPVARS
jgi:hypothetical protein